MVILTWRLRQTGLYVITRMLFMLPEIVIVCDPPEISTFAVDFT